MRRSETDLRVKGLGLRGRFVLSMTAALTLVMGAAAGVLYLGATGIAERILVDTISRAVRVTGQGRAYKQSGDVLTKHENGVISGPVVYGSPPRNGTVYQYTDKASGQPPFELLTPSSDKVGSDMLGIIVAITLTVILVGAAVAFWVANQVSRPIHKLIDDVRQISKGNLNHKTHAVGAGEIELLARSIDRMTRELSEGQEAHLELSIREREMDLAGGVREALLPLATPWIEGYDLGAAHIGSENLVGDFHDFIEHEDGRVGLLVCDVSGQGVPAALVGATARSYLRTELHRTQDVHAALSKINRWLADDVRRGMFVSALYVILDPKEGNAQVACAGHKIPLVRFAAEDQKLRVVQPDGIAFGFDKGPVFDRRLEIQEISVEPGDRLFLCNSAPVAIKNPEGRELGEKALFGRILKHAALDTTGFLKSMRRDLEHFAGDEGVPTDVSLVTLQREA